MKNLIITATLITLALTTMAFRILKEEKVIMMVTIEVKNAGEWKKSFDSGAPMREKSGIKVISIFSAMDNANHITVIEEAENQKAAKDFLALLKAKQQAGDMTKLDVKLYSKME